MNLKKIFNALVILLICGMMTNKMQAQVGDNTLAVESMQMERGSSATLSISLANVSEIACMQFTLTMPEGFSLNTSSAALTSRAVDHVLTLRSRGGNDYMAVVVSPTNSSFQGIQGDVMTITVTAPTNAGEGGDFPVTLSNVVLSLASGENVASNWVDGVINIAYLPDVHVSSLDCSDPTAGQPITVAYTVVNEGKGSTGDTQWTDYLWLMQDPSSTNNARLLASIKNMTSLEPGASYDNAITVTMPDRVYGNYYLVLCSDMATIKSGKAATKEINIAVPPLPDLQLGTVVAVVDNDETYSGELTQPSPITAAGLANTTLFYSGKKVKVRATLQNIGDLAASAAGMSTLLFLSHNSDPNAGGLTQIGSITNSISLEPGGEQELVISGTLPYTWYGNTYFHMQANSNEAVYELASNANNWASSPEVDVLLTPGADFRPESIIAPDSISANCAFDIKYEVKNIGPGVPYVSQWYDAIYLSSSPDGLDSRAILIDNAKRTGSYLSSAEGYVYSGDDYTATRTITLGNLSLQPGTYYFYVNVDNGDAVYEYQGEDNNLLCSEAVQLVETDIAVSLESVSEENVMTGDTFAVAWKITNTGQSTLSNLPLTDGIYVSANADGSNAVALGQFTNTLSLQPGAEKLLRANITVPTNKALNGDMQLFLRSNINGSIVESTTDNNRSESIPIEFEYFNLAEEEQTRIKGTNLSVSKLSVPSSLQLGEPLTISYRVTNTGTETIPSNVSHAVCLSKSANAGSGALYLDYTDVIPSVAGLESGKYVDVTIHSTVPADIQGGNYYAIATVNQYGAMAERTLSDNTVNVATFIEGHMPDLVVTAIDFPVEVLTAESKTATVTVANQGNWDASSTSCEIYLSADGTTLNKNNRIATLYTGRLAQEETVALTADYTVPDGKDGDWHMVAVVNSAHSVEESNYDNNQSSTSFTAQQSPLPDLAISDLVADEVAVAGSTITVTAKVKNVGESFTRKDKWADAFYLSPDYAFNPNTAISLGSKAHVGTLQAGEEYELSATLKVPTGTQGYYVLFAVIDANDAVYETSTANNRAYQVVVITNPTAKPSDLTLTSITVPSQVTAGERITVSYELANQSENSISGELRDVIYMSNDAELSIDDEIIGVVAGKVSIEPGNTLTRTAAGTVTNITEGNYFIIVKTNSTHNIAENNYDNNILAASHASAVAYSRLSVGETASLNASGLYKLAVHDGIAGQTLGLYLQHPTDEPAGMYVAYESVPSTAIYNKKSNNYADGEEELLIPNVLTGNYYLLAQASSAISLNQREWSLEEPSDVADAPMTINAKEVHFGITSLGLREGGNGGWITTDVHGALLDSIMDFRLIKGDEMIPVESITFYDTTSTRAIFNLNDAATGSYDVMSELPDGTQATLPDGFTVVTGTSSGLGIKMEVPSSATQMTNVPISVSYANGSNTDINIIEIVLKIDSGALATTIAGLDDEVTELHFVPDTGTDNRGYTSIAPGTQGTFNCFLRIPAGVSNLTVYVVK